MKNAVQEIIDAIEAEIEKRSDPDEYHKFEERCIVRGLTIARDKALQIRDRHFYPRIKVSWEEKPSE